MDPSKLVSRCVDDLLVRLMAGRTDSIVSSHRQKLLIALKASPQDRLDGLALSFCPMDVTIASLIPTSQGLTTNDTFHPDFPPLSVSLATRESLPSDPSTISRSDGCPRQAPGLKRIETHEQTAIRVP